MSSSETAVWNKEEEKAFENAIAMHWVEGDESKEQKWEKIASMVPSKDVEDLKKHFEMLVEDIKAIEAGNIPVPDYVGDREATISSNKGHNNRHGIHGVVAGSDKRSNSGGYGGGFSGLAHEGKGGGSRSEQERKKGIPWTEEEHRLFLLGLDKFGKGDWRSISRNYVISRTPTQVASHAQKYFIRLNSMNRDRRRSSIHDITSINNGDLSSSHQSPITGQQQTNTNPSSLAASGPPGKHRPHPHMGGFGVYGAPIGHPVSPPGPPPPHMGSAVGTPVMIPPRHHPHHHPPPYVVPIAYPMAPPAMQQ